MSRRTGMRNRVAALAAVTAFAVGLVSVAVLASRSGDDGLERLPALAAGGEAADMAMSARATAAPEPVEYVVATALPDLASEAPAYRLGRDADRAAVERLARALGITAPVDEDGGRFTAGLLVVEDAPGMPWYLSDAAPACRDAPVSSDDGRTMSVQGCAVASTTTSDVCTADGRSCSSAGSSSSSSSGASASPGAEPDRTAPPSDPAMPKGRPSLSPPMPVPMPPEHTSAPVAGLPARADAERIARQVFDALGVATDAMRLEGGTFSWEATVSPRVGGLEVLGMTQSLSIGPEGRVRSASGYLGTPERIGAYPLVGVETAFDRLRAAAGADDSPTPLVARADSSMRVVTITGVRLALQHVADKLVPVYLFEVDHGGTIPVPAVPDRYLEQRRPPGPARPDIGHPEPLAGVAPTGSSMCSGSAAASSPDSDNAPLTVEVCIEPATAKVGQEVVFRVTARDPDAPIAGEGCGGPYATFGDEAQAVTAACTPMCAAQRTKPPKEPGQQAVTYRHAYERPGTYTARFGFQSAACNPYGSRGEGVVTVEVR